MSHYDVGILVDTCVYVYECATYVQRGGGTAEHCRYLCFALRSFWGEKLHTATQEEETTKRKETNGSIQQSVDTVHTTNSEEKKKRNTQENQ
jgi:hypothetical protein